MGPDTRGEELIGKSIASYFVEHKLGAGATGIVFRVRKDGSPTPLALKVLHDNLGSIGSLRRRFEREARVLAKIDHPNVVHITDFGVTDGLTFIAMELLEGLTLEELLDAAPIDPGRGVDVLREVLRGLAYAHARSVVHRDLKPANVFLCRGGREGAPERDRVKLLDFGLAKILSDDDVVEEGTLTRRGRIVGTPAYMAPEQITGVSLDVRADVYAAGILLYELLCDRRPFLSDRRSELLRAHLLEPVPPLSVARPGLVAHPELEGIVLRALEKNPAARFADAQAMLDAMERLPLDAARLARDEPSPLRSRSGATGEVITSGERRAVSESASAPDVPGSSMRPPAAAEALTSAIPGAPTSDGTDGTAPAPPGPPAAAVADAAAAPAAPAIAPAAPAAAPAAGEGGPALSTSRLYLLAASLFAAAGILWWALGPR